MVRYDRPEGGNVAMDRQGRGVKKRVERSGLDATVGQVIDLGEAWDGESRSGIGGRWRQLALAWAPLGAAASSGGRRPADRLGTKRKGGN